MPSVTDQVETVAPRADGSKEPARSTTKDVERGAEEVRHSPVFARLARLGLLSRAVVYALVGALVIEIAVRGRSSSAADSQGAFAAISRRPAGREILGLVVVGLAAYALWRFVEAVSQAPQGQRVSAFTRLGWCGIGVVYVFLKEVGDMVSSTKGKVDRAKGKVKSAAGKATNNRSLKTKGRAQQTKGSAEQAAKKAKDIFTE